MNILLTSVGRRRYLVDYFKEALGETGAVHVSNSSALTPAFPAADASVITPLIHDESYIPFLLDYCKEHQITAVIPLFDIDLPVLSRNKKAFAREGIQVIVADPETIDICNDKWHTYHFLIKQGLCAPLTWLTVEDALFAVSRGKADFPLMVKPRLGMGSIAVYQADNAEELSVFYKKIIKEVAHSYLKYEAGAGEQQVVLIQQKLKGQEYGLDVICDLKGRYQNTIVKMKYAMRSGETDCAVTRTSPMLMELGRTLGQMLKAEGNLDVDVFLEDGQPYILEMNARFGGGYPFSHMAGANLPKAIIAWLSGEEACAEWLKAKPDVLSHKDIELKILEK